MAGGSSSQVTSNFNNESFPPLLPGQDLANKNSVPTSQPSHTAEVSNQAEIQAVQPQPQGKTAQPPQEDNLQTPDKLPPETSNVKGNNSTPDFPEPATLAEVNRDLQLSEESEEDMQGITSESKRQASSDDTSTSMKKKKKPSRSPKKK